MEFLQLNRDRLDSAISFLNNSLDTQILIGQKIKLISMFHNILDLYDKESIFVSASKNRIVVKIEIKDRTLNIPSYVKNTIRLYNGEIRTSPNSQLIILMIKRKNYNTPQN